MSGRFLDFVVRHRRRLFWLWLVHALLLHWFVLGYVTGDGLSYRVMPVIELLQHGSLGSWKYPTDWSLAGNVPVVELVHLPFLALLGLRGLLVGFPLVVLPLCALAVARLVRDLTDDARAGTIAGWAYVAMPMVNAQAFAGLVDFVVIGILAAWLRSLLRLARGERSGNVVAWFACMTALLGASRQHGLYLALVLVPLVAILAVPAQRWLIVARASIAFGIGSLPAIALQIYRAVMFGSPVAPSELRILGMKLAAGVPMRWHLACNGIPGDDLASLAHGFLDGWVWQIEWPMGAFHHSQFMGAGFLTVFALITLPVFVRTATRTEGVLVIAFVAASLLARDFALPRWSYTLAVALVIIVGRTIASLAATPDASPAISRRWRPLAWVGIAILTLQLLRPELDLIQINTGHWISPRVNVAASPWFAAGPGRLNPLPDRGFKIVLIERTSTTYTVHLFGRMLTNEIVGTVRASELGSRCEGVRGVLAQHPDAVFLDELQLTTSCDRSCRAGTPCRLFAIRPPDPVRK